VNEQRFYAYVRSQSRRDDPVGRVGRSLMHDVRIKRVLRLSTISTVRTHLAARGAGADALEGLAQAAAEFAQREPHAVDHEEAGA
jgi:hypothetical protein